MPWILGFRNKQVTHNSWFEPPGRNEGGRPKGFVRSVPGLFPFPSLSIIDFENPIPSFENKAPHIGSYWIPCVGPLEPTSRISRPARCRYGLIPPPKIPAFPHHPRIRLPPSETRGAVFDVAFGDFDEDSRNIN